MQTRILPNRSSQQTKLEQLVLRYRQLAHMIAQENNRREKLPHNAQG